MLQAALGLGRLDAWIEQAANNPWGLLELQANPRATGEELARRFDAAEAWRHAVGLDTQFETNVSPYLKRLLRGGVLELDELRELSLLVTVLCDLKVQAEGFSPPIRDPLESFSDYDALARVLVRSVGADGQLRDEASDVLGGLRRGLTQARRRLSESADEVVEDLDRQGILQDRFVTQRRDRQVVPVRAGMQSRMDGKVRDSSRSGATAFVEPAVLADRQQALEQAKEAVDAEEERIIRSLCVQLAERAKELQVDVITLGRLDADRVRGTFARTFGGVRPQFSPDRLEFKGLQPTALLLAGIEDPVPSNLTLERDHGLLVVSGPNGGGKSVLLTSIGWAWELAQRGLPVPAESIHLPPPPFRLAAVLGDPSHLETGASTFQAHLRLLVDVLSQPSDLVLVDELCSGTEPVAGSALACAVAEALAQQDGFQIITTHYDPVKSLGQTHPQMRTAAFFDPGRDRAFQLHRDEISTADPLATALVEGLPEAVISGARDYLDQSRNQRLDQLQDLDRQQAHLDARIEQMKAESAALERRNEALNQREAKLAHKEHQVSDKEVRARRRREDQREALTRAGLARLDTLQDELREAVRRLRNDPRLSPALRREGEKLYDDVRDLKASYQKSVPVVDRPRMASGPPPQPGDRVKVLSTGAKGKLERVQGHRARVNLGGLDLELDLDEIIKIDDLPGA